MTTATSTERLRGWLSGRLPDEWFTEAPELRLDRDEVVIIGRLAEPKLAEDAKVDEQAAAADGRIQEFRRRTRDQRIAIASELERSTGRKVSWGVRCADTEELFTTLSAPAMTRLRQPERRVLDTLVDAGVARSRSDALAWCVRLVGQHEQSWLSDLRSAMERVEEVREEGPASNQG